MMSRAAGRILDFEADFGDLALVPTLPHSTNSLTSIPLSTVFMVSELVFQRYGTFVITSLRRAWDGAGERAIDDDVMVAMQAPGPARRAISLLSTVLPGSSVPPSLPFPPVHYTLRSVKFIRHQ